VIPKANGISLDPLLNDSDTRRGRVLAHDDNSRTPWAKSSDLTVLLQHVRRAAGLQYPPHLTETLATELELTPVAVCVTNEYRAGGTCMHLVDQSGCSFRRMPCSPTYVVVRSNASG
jgi:hypothetical protein